MVDFNVDVVARLVADIYPIALRAYPATVPISRKRAGNEDGARVCLVVTSALREWGPCRPSSRGALLNVGAQEGMWVVVYAATRISGVCSYMSWLPAGGQ